MCFLTTTGLLSVQLTIFCFHFFNWFRIVNLCFVTSKNICKLSLIELGKHFYQLLGGLYSYPFWSSVNICSILLYFQNKFQNDMHTRQRHATTFTVSLVFNMLINFQLFPGLICLACYRDRLNFAASFTDSVPVRHFFIHLRTVS